MEERRSRPRQRSGLIFLPEGYFTAQGRSCALTSTRQGDISAAAASAPDRNTFSIPQDKGIVSFYYFPSQDQFCIALLDFRAGD